MTRSFEHVSVRVLKTNNFSKNFLLLSTALVLAQPVHAQTGQLAPTREELQRRETPNVAAPRIEIEGGLEREPCALDNPEFADVKFTLRDVEFTGLGNVDSWLFRPAYANLVGREHNVSVVCDIRDRAASLLRDAGYIVAIQVPEQSIAEGRTPLHVVLARMTDIRVRGDAGRGEKLISSYLERLKERPVFNRYEAERYLLLAGDVPGYTARLALRPAGSGARRRGRRSHRFAPIVDGRRQRAQNYGSQELGRFGGQIRAQFFGLTGMGDVTSFSALFDGRTVESKRHSQATHDFQARRRRTAVLSSLGYTWARPDIDGRDTIRARTLVGSLAISYPFVRSQSSTLRGIAGIDLVNQVIRHSGDAISRDRLRISFGRLNWDAISLDFSRPGFSFFEPLWRLGASAEAATRHRDL